jgi:hypothetical protein
MTDLQKAIRDEIHVSLDQINSSVTMNEREYNRWLGYVRALEFVEDLLAMGEHQ